jgi:hypothetical protein
MNATPEVNNGTEGGHDNEAVIRFLGLLWPVSDLEMSWGTNFFCAFLHHIIVSRLPDGLFLPDVLHHSSHQKLDSIPRQPLSRSSGGQVPSGYNPEQCSLRRSSWHLPSNLYLYALSPNLSRNFEKPSTCSWGPSCLSALRVEFKLMASTFHRVFQL